MKQFFLFAVLILIVGTSHGQHINMLAYSELDQSHPYLPAQMKQDSGLTIVLPGVSTAWNLGQVPIGDIFVTDGSGTSSLDFTNVIDKIPSTNNVLIDAQIPVLGFDLRKGSNQFSLGYGFRTFLDLEFSKGFIDLYHFGNGPFVGEEMDLSHRFDISAYHQLSFGYAKSFGGISLGGRVKWLSGVDNISSGDNQMSLYTDPDIYQLTLSSADGAEFHSAGGIVYNGVDSIDVNYKAIAFRNLGSNTGFGYDLGISGDFEKFHFGLSILDIGKIKWNKDVRTYTSASETLYEGLDLLDFFNDETDIIVEDSLKQLLSLEERFEEYETDLRTRINAVLGFNLTPKYGLTVSYFRDLKSNYSGIGLVNRFDFGRIQAHVSIASVDSNLALGTALKLDLKPMQLYLTLDNALGVFDPSATNYSALTFGWNLSF